jgi:hypothetical protein
MSISPSAITEDIEGLGQDDDGSIGYPIDTLLIRNETRTVHDVLRRISAGSFVMDPEFQRDFVWDKSKQSKLIESVLMRIPLPVFYLGEDDAGKMIVVDGLQRLTTFQHFVDNQFQLNLPSQPELHKKKFKELPDKMKNRIEDCNLIIYIIDSKVPEKARLDIFDRVNGGEPLTRQQMRNCLFTGPATRFLKTQAASMLFVKGTGDSLKSKTMRDREFVNRFCAFQLLDVDDYTDMDRYLADALKKMNKKDTNLDALGTEFQVSLQNNIEVFGDNAFRKPNKVEGRRSPLNASFWDVMSTGLSRYPTPLVLSRKAELRRAISILLEEKEFDSAITYGPNAADQVRRRFVRAREVLAEVLSAHAA